MIDSISPVFGAKLNQKLKKEDSKRTVTVFFWIPAQQYGLRTEILENKAYFRHIKNYVDYNAEEIMKKMSSDFII